MCLSPDPSASRPACGLQLEGLEYRILSASLEGTEKTQDCWQTMTVRKVELCTGPFSILGDANGSL